MTQKTVWIINQYASTPETGIGGRHYYIAQEFAKLGYKIYLIAGSYSHLLYRPKTFKEDILFDLQSKNFNFVWVKLPTYESAHSNKRIINEFIFSYKLSKLVNKIPDKPDLVIHSAPALLSYFGAYHLAKKFNVPYVFEERDLWPLTLVELGGYSVKHPFIQLLQWTEDKAYRSADFVFSNLSNAVEHMQNRGGIADKFSWIPNGISLDEMENKEPLSEQLIAQIPQDKFIVGYTGTLGVANAVDDLIDVAQNVSCNEHIHFVLVGSGKERAELINKAQKFNLQNITFIESIPKKQIQSMLALFDVCYIGWHDNPLYRFGISPNKLPEYMYAGKPIIHAFSGKGDMVAQSNAGITVPARDISIISQAVIKMANMSKDQLTDIGKNGHEFVKKNLTYKQITRKIIDVIWGNKCENI